MNDTIIFIKSPLEYSHWEQSGAKYSSGKAVAVVEKENLAILSQAGQDLVFSLREIEEINATNYRISIQFVNGEQIHLERLGYRYEDFLRILHFCRNELILQDMLAQETILLKDVPAEVALSAESGLVSITGKCRVRVYETSLAILPVHGEIFRLPFGYLKEITTGDYTIHITGEMGEQITLSKLGNLLDPLFINIKDGLDNLSTKTQVFLKGLLPALEGAPLRSLAELMKDGRATSKQTVDAISPTLWVELEKVLKTTTIGPRYDYLTATGNRENVYMGFKRGLMGDLTGDTVWFLVPFYSENDQEPGNAVVMEVARLPHQEDSPSNKKRNTTEETEGYATYAFRFCNREKYHLATDMAGLEKELHEFIRAFNRNLADINFRRTPIYLPAARFAEPTYQKYWFSLKRLASLQMLRLHFIGRVIHRSENQWQNDLQRLLTFNVNSLDDQEKWEKGD